jgi:hypothetical protein
MIRACSRGPRIGASEIVGPRGAGGMGDVYRARDGNSNATSPSTCSRLPWSAGRTHSRDSSARLRGAVNRRGLINGFHVDVTFHS